MKDKLNISDYEKQLLNQRGTIETIMGPLKHGFQVWHTRHHFPINVMVCYQLLLHT